MKHSKLPRALLGHPPHHFVAYVRVIHIYFIIYSYFIMDKATVADRNCWNAKCNVPSREQMLFFFVSERAYQLMHAEIVLS